MITEDTNQMSLERMKAKIRGILQSVREESGLRAIGPPLIAEHFKGIHELQTEVPSHDFAKLLENAAKSILFEITVRVSCFENNARVSLTCLRYRPSQLRKRDFVRSLISSTLHWWLLKSSVLFPNESSKSFAPALY